MNNKKRATCFVTVLQYESVISDVARFTTHENKPNCNLICCKTGSKVGAKYKTCNITIQLSLFTDKT